MQSFSKREGNRRGQQESRELLLQPGLVPMALCEAPGVHTYTMCTHTQRLPSLPLQNPWHGAKMKLQRAPRGAGRDARRGAGPSAASSHKGSARAEDVSSLRCPASIPHLQNRDRNTLVSQQGARKINAIFEKHSNFGISPFRCVSLQLEFIMKKPFEVRQHTALGDLSGGTSCAKPHMKTHEDGEVVGDLWCTRVNGASLSPLI